GGERPLIERREKHHVAPGLAIAPEHVRVAVAVEITDSLREPRRHLVAGARRGALTPGLGIGPPPEVEFLGSAAPPQQAGDAIAIEIARRQPARGGLAPIQHGGPGVRRAGKVDAAVTIEVAQCERLERPERTGGEYAVCKTGKLEPCLAVEP